MPLKTESEKGSLGKSFKIKEGSKRFKIQSDLKATLGSGDLWGAVRLPLDTNVKEWIAVNVADFYQQLQLLFKVIEEHCNQSSCPVMSAGPKYEYLWADGKEIKKPIQLCAHDYIENLFTFADDILNDDQLFPDEGIPFPKEFIPTVKQLFKRGFRVYAHLCYNHAQHIMDAGITAHFNTAFKHFYLFIREFQLVEPQEMIPLQDHIDEINSRYPPQATTYNLDD